MEVEVKRDVRERSSLARPARVRHRVTCKSCGGRRLHFAKGQCKSCYVIERWPDRWPHWLRACLICGASRAVANYHKHGLCKPCVLRLSEDEVAAWAVASKALVRAARLVKGCRGTELRVS